MNLDDQLHAALRRKAPPPSLADRVMKAIDEPAQPVRMPARARMLRGAIAAGLVLFVASGIWLERERQQRIELAQGEAAKQLALIALHIASEKANVARERVMRTDDHSTTKGSNDETTVNP